MRGCNGRHANVSGEFVTTSTEPTSVGLIAFGYPTTISATATGSSKAAAGSSSPRSDGLTVGGDTFAFEGEGGG